MKRLITICSEEEKILANRIILAVGLILPLVTVLPGRAEVITIKSDASTLSAALGAGSAPPTMLVRLDTADVSGLTFMPVLVGAYGSFTPIPPGAPPNTAVVNIPPGDGESGYFMTMFTLPSGFDGINLTGSANVDDYGRVFLNGQPISPSIFSNGTISEYGNVTFGTQNASYFQPGENILLLSCANGGGPSAAAFYVNVSFTPIPEPATLLLLGLGGLAVRRKRS